MAAGKRQQNSTMITLVFFVALFLVAATLAVVFYLKAENYRTTGVELQRQVDDLATRSEISQMSTLVGARESGLTWLGSTVEYHNRLMLLLMGSPVDTTKSAELQSSAAQTRVVETIELARPHIEGEQVDPNTGLVPVARKLIAAIEVLKSSKAELTKQMAALTVRVQDIDTASKEREGALLKQMEDLKQAADEANKQSEQYRKMVDQSSDERAKTLMEGLDRERTRADELNQDLLKTRAEQGETQKRLQLALDKVRRIEPDLNRSAELYRADGKVTVVDEHAGVVYLNLGSRDRIYQGLTFAVFDGAGAIPKDGKGKAEVEVFRIMADSCTARVVSKDPRRPIVIDDIVANLIWDKDKVTKFVLAGDFDANRDGRIDPDGIEAVSRLMEKWGAETTGDLSAYVDAVVLGQPPMVPPKPTPEDLEVDPLAQQKVDAAQIRLERFRAVQEQAQALMLPILPYDTFLYLIGYRGQSQRPGAF